MTATTLAPVPPAAAPRQKKLSLGQLFNLSAGIIGLQFAWSMQIALSSRVLEPLGADPFLFGAIWCAGPITGLLIQPLVGAISDRTWTRLGRRRPFILTGALLGALAILAFPFAPALWVGALLTWIIDACLNTAQGPYRALVPDNAPPEQHAVANSFINFAFGAGSVIALGVAPLLKTFNIPMSVEQQYVVASVALLLTITYASLTIREIRHRPGETEKAESGAAKGSLMDSIRRFKAGNPEIHKLCAVQFVTWVGLMCMYIYLTPYVVHHVYKLPDMSSPPYKQVERTYRQVEPLLQRLEAAQASTHQPAAMPPADASRENAALAALAQEAMQIRPESARQPLWFNGQVSASNIAHYREMKRLDAEATNTAQLALVAYNLVALLLTIPLGYLCGLFGKKKLYSYTLVAYAAAMAFAPWVSTPEQAIGMMAVAGIGGATILSLPFAMLCEYLPEGDEGAVLGIFNVFVCAPQLISALVIGKIIEMNPLMTPFGMTHQWWIAFATASIFVFLSALALQAFKERFPGRMTATVSAGH
jgi:maltose/moltooligosaccharide transporter